MAWTDLADALFVTGQPGKGSIFKQLRDNITAITEGASGAPQILTAAIEDAAVTVVKLEVDLIPNEIAGFSIGAIGTYAFLARNAVDAAISTGSTYAGSGLAYIGANVANTVTAPVDGTPLGGTPSGTWRAMGYCSADPSKYASTVFLRIS